MNQILEMAKKMIKKPGRYGIVVDRNFDLQSITYLGVAGTYNIEVDNFHNTLKVTNNNIPVKYTRVQVATPKDHHPRAPSDMAGLPAPLDAGCVGLAQLVPAAGKKGKGDQCQWLFDTWW